MKTRCIKCNRPLMMGNVCSCNKENVWGKNRVRGGRSLKIKIDRKGVKKQWKTKNVQTRKMKTLVKICR